MKIAVIGGGSTYTPELVSGFLDSATELPLRELWLMDTDSTRLQVVGGFAARMVAARGNPFKIILSPHQQQAIAGASYVITQFRVGQMPARIRDEYLGRRNGLIGQETTGVGGMAKALRTIPVMLEIANEITQSAPQAILLNFTNPSGLVTEALARHAPGVKAVGVCNVGITTKMQILARAETLLNRQMEPEQVVLDSLGLNHLTWHRGFAVKGEELWQQIFPLYLDELRQSAQPEWDPDMLETLGMLPNDYLHYYYDTARKLAEQEKWPPSRGEEVVRIEQDLLKQYADPALTSPPADLMLRGGAFYSTLASRLIRSHFHDLGEVEVVNIRNNRAVKEWPSDWVLELPCKVDRSGFHPLGTNPLPKACTELVWQVKMFELFTIEAAIHGDRSSALQALQIHPLGPNREKAQAVLDDLLMTHREYLPQFFQ